MFESTRWRVISLGMIFCDFILIIVYARFLIPKDGIVLSAQTVTRNLYTATVILMACMLTDYFFDDVRQHMFDELRDYSDRVEKATREKEVFFACMSHEIRNPLQSLLGSVELLQQQNVQQCGLDCSPKRQSSSYDKFIAIIKSGCDVVLNLVSNILDISKIEANKMELAPVPSSLSEDVGKVLRLMSDRAKGRGLRLLHKEGEGLPPCLLFDPSRLHQVVLNLVSNAIKFTQRGKVVVCTKWIPLPAAGDIGPLIRQELDTSDWKSILDPLEEVDDEKEELTRRMRVQSASGFVPSDHSGRQSRGLDSDALGGEEAPTNRDRGNSTHAAAAGTGEGREPSRVIKGLIKVEVMDTGIGISKEGVKKLFRLFQQADSSISQYAALV